MSCGVGRRRGLGLALLWLRRRPVATAPIRPLAWEPPYATGAALEKDPPQKRYLFIFIQVLTLCLCGWEIVSVCQLGSHLWKPRDIFENPETTKCQTVSTNFRTSSRHKFQQRRESSPCFLFVSLFVLNCGWKTVLYLLVNILLFLLNSDITVLTSIFLP